MTGRPWGIEAVGRSHRGRVRRTNEDAFFIDDRQPDLTRRGVWQTMGVADGLGGHPWGEVASEIAVDVSRHALAGSGPDVDHEVAGWRRSLETCMAEAFAESHRQMQDRAEHDPDYLGMGSTLVLAALARGSLIVAHTGDSRAYLVRGASVRQLTTDHTWAEDERKRGRFSEEVIRASPVSGHLTRALGVTGSVRPDVAWIDLLPGDLVLLATDGLTRYVDPQTYAAVVAGDRPLSESADDLVSRANRAGGLDNATVILARFNGLSEVE